MHVDHLDVLDDLTVVADRRVVAQLRPAEAFDLAEQLVRRGMRCAMAEEAAALVANGADAPPEAA